jgi:hypothetical protein
MRLANRFKEEDKMRVWVDHQFCVICSSNQNCSLHHIDGCKNEEHASIYNSSMLCHIHHKIADGHNTNSPLSIDFRNNLRRITFAKVTRSDHVNTPLDEKYNSLHKANNC